MQVKAENARYDSVVMSFKEYVEVQIDRGAFSDDRADNAKQTAEFIGEAFGRLLETLADKGVLTLSEAVEITTGADSGAVEEA